MKYLIEFKKTAVKDIERIDKKESLRILNKIKLLEDGLKGDVKRLTNYTPEFRLRIGKFRVLFEVIENVVIIYRVKHRKESYK